MSEREQLQIYFFLFLVWANLGQRIGVFYILLFSCHYFTICAFSVWQANAERKVGERRREQRSKNEIHSQKLYIKLCLAKWKRFSALTKASVHIGKSITAATTTTTEQSSSGKSGSGGGSSIQVNELNVELCWTHTHTHTAAYGIERTCGYAIVHRSRSACASALSKDYYVPAGQWILTFFFNNFRVPKWIADFGVFTDQFDYAQKSCSLWAVWRSLISLFPPPSHLRSRSLSIYSSIYLSISFHISTSMHFENSLIRKCDNILTKVGVFYIYNGHNLNKWVEWISIFM